MADRVPQPKVYDPQMVPEVVCDGPMNIHWIGDRGVITFALRDLLVRLLPADKPAVEMPARGGTTSKLH